MFVVNSITFRWCSFCQRYLQFLCLLILFWRILNPCLVVQPKSGNCETLNVRFTFINLTHACKWYLLVQTSSSLTSTSVPLLCCFLFCLQSRNISAEWMPWEECHFNCFENTGLEWVDGCGLIQLHEGKSRISLTFFVYRQTSTPWWETRLWYFYSRSTMLLIP